MVRASACFQELAAFTLQPAYGAFRVPRHGIGEVRVCDVAAECVDHVAQDVLARHDIAHTDVQRATGVAGIAEILYVLPLFENACRQPEFGGSVRRGKSGDTATDDHDIEFRHAVGPA